MDNKGVRRSEGSCIIAEEVIAAIASTAALEISGVAGMAPRPNDLRNFIGSGACKSVRVVNNDNVTSLDVYIFMSAGANIPDTAGGVQQAVKVAVQSMTGKPVTKVNVHIAGLMPDPEK
ncbi:MAG: Asp23/Gls24 family envelope stress response protein [Oscillospiraceae bacterium]|nr:Asp23/Gls24 family envelope stress response protein [Oscillospiraceae bacterium]